MQGIGCVPMRIFPDFKTRLRGGRRLSINVSSLLPQAGKKEAAICGEWASSCFHERMLMLRFCPPVTPTSETARVCLANRGQQFDRSRHSGLGAVVRRMFAPLLGQ